VETIVLRSADTRAIQRPCMTAVCISKLLETYRAAVCVSVTVHTPLLYLTQLTYVCNCTMCNCHRCYSLDLEGFVRHPLVALVIMIEYTVRTRSKEAGKTKQIRAQEGGANTNNSKDPLTQVTQQLHCHSTYCVLSGRLFRSMPSADSTTQRTK
jgi:hypothetical protein